jgi:hypothetical protein
MKLQIPFYSFAYELILYEITKKIMQDQLENTHIKVETV